MWKHRPVISEVSGSGGSPVLSDQPGPLSRSVKLRVSRTCNLFQLFVSCGAFMLHSCSALCVIITFSNFFLSWGFSFLPLFIFNIHVFIISLLFGLWVFIKCSILIINTRSSLTLISSLNMLHFEILCWTRLLL